MLRRLLVLVAGLICVAGPAAAADVYFNGVKVTGAIAGQSFENVTVRFDEKGDVHVSAPGFKVEVAKPTTPTPPTPAVAPPTAAVAPAKPAPPPVNTPRYWLVLNASRTGHYKVQMRANGHPVADVPANSPQYVADITEKLYEGDNVVEVTFLPLPGAPPGPPAEAVTVMVGYGVQAPDGTLTIQRLMGTAKQNTGSAAATAQSIRFSLN
ncbi:MAG: hypothetical protein H6704_19500 [Myxococcales bacterium]|nr:hypothetical protein [Myxococcales bacterium]